MSERWERREQRRNAERNRMQKHSMGLFLIVRLQVERSQGDRPVNVSKKRHKRAPPRRSNFAPHSSTERTRNV